MSRKSTVNTPVAIVSLSLDRDLLNLLDEQAEHEGRTRSKMLSRMIEFYLNCRLTAMVSDVQYADTDSIHMTKARLSSIYGEFHNKENSPEA